jgi:hypothetical protein
VAYFLKSILTFSFWRYALFSGEALARVASAAGVLFVFIEMLDFFKMYERTEYGKFAIVPILLVSIVYVIVSRRPITKVSYKAPGKDFLIEVKITDLFDEEGDVVISTNTTFDTDISSGLINKDSLQGQLALRFFNGNTHEIDKQLEAELKSAPYTDVPNAVGKKREYPLGTVAKVKSHGKNFYFVAMARLNSHGNAVSSIRDVEDSLNALWAFVKDKGDLRDLVVPLMGTGRGRIELSRKKVIERIAQSFADSAAPKRFSNRLVIAVRPKDAENFAVNLFEIKDYLSRSLHF